MSRLATPRLKLGMLLLVIAAFGATFWDVYVHWNRMGFFASHARHDASEVLEKVQAIQRDCKARLARHCRDVPELLRVHRELHGSGYVTEVRKLEDQPVAYPGLSTDSSFSGSAYFVSILRADESSFLAEARHCGFARFGEDVWTIEAEGAVRHAIVSKAFSTRSPWVMAPLPLLAVGLALFWSLVSGAQKGRKARPGLGE